VAIDGLHQVTGAGADVAELLANTDAVAGQIAFEIMAEGIRMSSSVLIGGLEGGSKVTLSNGQLARLDPTACDTVISKMDSALASGALTFRPKPESVSRAVKPE
jgi:hypothetical protein